MIKSGKEKFELRLQKFIADCGYTSRRKAEDLIVQGRVLVNGEIRNQLGTKVTPNEDVVTIDGDILDLKTITQKYIVMNKPRGCVTTLSDPEGRPTVMDLCKEISERIYPVGRLDYLSEGLLVLTNDGAIGNMIMHPSFDIEKVYEVKVFGVISPFLIKKLRSGVKLSDGFAKPLSVRIIKQLGGKTWLEFRLNEGRNREIRRICEACGITVDKLRRVAIGGLTVVGISPGKFRYITKKQLLESLGMREDGTKSGKKLPVHFSAKRTIKVSSKRRLKRTKTDALSADDKTFHKFRRENYFETLEQIKKTKEAVALAEKMARRRKPETDQTVDLRN